MRMACSGYTMTDQLHRGYRGQGRTPARPGSTGSVWCCRSQCGIDTQETCSGSPDWGGKERETDIHTCTCILHCLTLTFILFCPGAVVPASSPTVAVLLTEVTCGHAGAGVVAGLARVQARRVVIAVVGLALQLGLNLAVMV